MDGISDAKVSHIAPLNSDRKNGVQVVAGDYVILGDCMSSGGKGDTRSNVPFKVESGKATEVFSKEIRRQTSLLMVSTL